MKSFQRILLALLVCLMPPVMTVTAADIPSSPDRICPLLIGSSVPTLSLTSADGTGFDLNAALGKKPTILIFYRGGW